MELVSFVKEVLQNAAERAASYRLGQTVLRYMDRALWTVEKSARWAVPPPLDQDERPQPELIRPLPWVFFLSLLIVLRVARESISLVNLALGKPPLRSADVVTYIQSKRRYLRTLKYQGNRVMRARTEPATGWFSSLQSLFEFTMCFRRRHYGNNNTQLSNGDEVLVVKRNKRDRQTEAGSSMERLIEKMMVDIDADSDDSSGYTLTNITSARSEKSDYMESDQENTNQVNQPTENNEDTQTQDNTGSLYANESRDSTILHDNILQDSGAGCLDENDLNACDTIYRFETKYNNMKEFSDDFIRNEISPQIKQFINSQHTFSNGRTAKGSLTNKNSTDDSRY